jgi:hypothetical protein
MIEYYDGPATAQAIPTARSATTVPLVTTRATATPIVPAAHLIKRSEQWNPEDLRDYIAARLTEFNPTAAARRNPAMEMAICKAFCERWGDQAPRIARYAFEFAKGWWNNSPIDFRRFSKASDAYFANVIVGRLPQATA